MKEGIREKSYLWKKTCQSSGSIAIKTYSKDPLEMNLKKTESNLKEKQHWIWWYQMKRYTMKADQKDE